MIAALHLRRVSEDDAGLGEVRRSVARFVEHEISPHITAWEAQGSAPVRELIGKLGAAGFIGMDLPQSDGGAGLDFFHALALAEELGGMACAGLAAALSCHIDHAVPLLAACGDAAARAQWLGPLVRGEKVACAPWLTRDDIAMPQEAWVCNGRDADVLVWGTRFLPLDAPRVAMRAAPRQLGLWSVSGATIGVTEGVAPEADAAAFALWQSKRRILEAARSLRWMERLVQQTLDYTGQRKVFGKPLLAREAVSGRLAELTAEIEGLRALCVHAAAHVVAGLPAQRLAAAAQLKAARLQHRVADDCLQLWGGMGFMAENPPATAWRDSAFAGAGQIRWLLRAISQTMEAA